MRQNGTVCNRRTMQVCNSSVNRGNQASDGSAGSASPARRGIVCRRQRKEYRVVTIQSKGASLPTHHEQGCSPPGRDRRQDLNLLLPAPGPGEVYFSFSERESRSFKSAFTRERLHRAAAGLSSVAFSFRENPTTDSRNSPRGPSLDAINGCVACVTQRTVAAQSSVGA